MTTTKEKKTPVRKPRAVKAAGSNGAKTPKLAGSKETVSAAVQDNRKRYEMIAEAAYYIAESRGFVPGDAMEDWLQAEKALIETLKA